MKIFKMFNDDRHGWLEVERGELEKLGIIDKISVLSRQKGSLVYLEEDMDAKIFLDALGTKDIHFDEKYAPISHIRKYQPFRGGMQ